LLGAAMMGLVAIGSYRSLREAVENMIKIVDAQHPNMENHKEYEKAYSQFKKLYGVIKEFYREQHNYETE